MIAGLSRLARALSLTVAFAGLAACTAPVDTAKETDALRTLEANWVRQFNSHQNNQMLANYDDHAFLAAPGAPAAIGAEAIKQSYASTFADPGFNIHFAPDRIDVAKSGDMAYTAGRYRQVTTDPKTKAPVVEVGSYVTVYRKQADGGWKSVADINTPEPGTVPPAG
jgi:ketosteroid isomerase-like protein